MSLELLNRIKAGLEERKKRVENGGINCIPLAFNRFRKELPGVEQGSYYLVSGSTKAAKTQLTNYIFVYSTILYCYYNPNKITPKIFFFPLEETAETITLRFIAYLLFHLTKGKVRISPTDLKSTDERFPVKQEILDLMDGEEFKKIMEFYENTITFYDDRNATGVWKILNNYAKANGTIHKKTIKIKEQDAFGNINEIPKEIFDYYTPNDPNAYVMIIVDHVSLLNPERNMDLRQSINKLSEYMVILRNRYNYIPVIVQQQSTETQNSIAVKDNKIRPTVAGLADSKYTARDCNVMIGITNPHAYDIREYLGYPIGEHFKSNIRFLEVVINRNGNANGICPLFFDGAINDFKELPLPSEKEALDKVIVYLNKIRMQPKETTAMLAYTIHKSYSNSKKVIKKLHRWKIFHKFATLFK